MNCFFKFKINNYVMINFDKFLTRLSNSIINLLEEGSIITNKSKHIPLFLEYFNFVDCTC